MKFYKTIFSLAIFLNFSLSYALNIKKEYSEKYMQDLHKWLPNSFEELEKIKLKDENILYRMAIENFHYHQDKTNFYTEEELRKIEKFVDIEKINTYFLLRLNSDRKKMGLTSNIQYDETLIKAAKIRSNELSSSKKISHKRPNKKEFWTAIDEVNAKYSQNSSFENALKTSIANEAQMISEKYIANHFYELWKSSKGHWKAMTDAQITKIGINFSFGFSDDKNFLSQINYGIMLGIK